MTPTRTADPPRAESRGRADRAGPISAAARRLRCAAVALDPPGDARGVLELDHIDAAIQMVLAGLGVALLPTTAVASELRSGSLRRVDLIGTPRIERRIAALRRLDGEGRSAAQVGFWSLLEAFDVATGSTEPAGPTVPA